MRCLWRKFFIRLRQSDQCKDPHPVFLDLAESLSHIDELNFIKLYNNRLCASKENGGGFILRSPYRKKLICQHFDFHSPTVSGLTMTRDLRQGIQIWESKTQKSRSAHRIFGRLFVLFITPYFDTLSSSRLTPTYGILNLTSEYTD